MRRKLTKPEVNETENRKNNTDSQQNEFFEMIDQKKKKKEENTQITKIKNEKENIVVTNLRNKLSRTSMFFKGVGDFKCGRFSGRLFGELKKRYLGISNDFL